MSDPKPKKPWTADPATPLGSAREEAHAFIRAATLHPERIIAAYDAAVAAMESQGPAGRSTFLFALTMALADTVAPFTDEDTDRIGKETARALAGTIGPIEALSALAMGLMHLQMDLHTCEKEGVAYDPGPPDPVMLTVEEMDEHEAPVACPRCRGKRVTHHPERTVN